MKRRSQSRLEALTQASDVARFVEHKGLEPKKSTLRKSKVRWVELQEERAICKWVDLAKDFGAQKVLTSTNKAGYYGVCRMSNAHTRSRPYQAQVRINGRHVYLGAYSTAEEAATAVATSAAGRNAAFLASVRKGVNVPASASAFQIAPEPMPSAEDCVDARASHAKGGSPSWWTTEEDRRLLYATYLVGSWNQPSHTGKWDQVAQLVGTRNARQCRRRWSTSHNAALLSAHKGVRPNWPPPPRPRKCTNGAHRSAERRRKGQQKDAGRAVPETPPALDDNDDDDDDDDDDDPLPDAGVLAAFLVEGGCNVGDEVDDSLSFEVPDFMQDGQRDDIYDHYGLAAIETLPEHDAGPAPAPPVARCLVVGKRFGGSFRFGAQPVPKKQLMHKFMEEDAIRGQQAMITDYMVQVYKNC